jgi:hypothetical protein
LRQANIFIRKLGTLPIFLKGVNNGTEKKKKWSRLRYEDF